MATETAFAHRDISSRSKAFITDEIQEPEINSINFRQSLKFFQEQLTINGNSFPTTSSLSLNENVSREPSNDNGIQSKQDGKDPFRKDPSSGKIKIPTVDTILESVRVLRAIQKSQEERNAMWNVSTTSSMDDQLLESITNFSNSETKPSFEIGEGRQNSITNNTDETVHTNIPNKMCPFWPSNIIPKEKYENLNESLTHENIKHQIVLESKNANASYKTAMHKLRPVLEKNCFIKLKESDNLGYIFEQDQIALTGESIIEDSNDILQSIENRTFKIADLSQENLKAQYIIAFVTEPSSPNPNCIEVQSNQLASMAKVLSGSSADEHNVKKLSNFDGDSGIGVQRSPISSCSRRKDSWSDSCSSLYVSAECSPCPSLSSLFDSSIGFNSYLPSLVTDSLDAEYQENVWEEDAFETQMKDVFPTCKNKQENKIVEEQHSDLNRTLITNLADAVSNPSEREEMKTSEQSNVCDWQDPHIIPHNEERIPKQSEISDSPADENSFPSDSNENGLSILDTTESHKVAKEATTGNIVFQEAYDNGTNALETDETEILNAQKKQNPQSIVTSAHLTNDESRKMPKKENYWSSNICLSTNAEVESGAVTHPESREMASSEEEKQENSYSSFSSIELKLPCSTSYVIQNGYESNINNASSSYETFKSTEESLMIIDDQYATKERDNPKEKSGKDAEVEVRQRKITSSSWNVLSIIESLYELMEYATDNICSERQDYEENVFVLSKSTFSSCSEGTYKVSLQNSSLTIKSLKDSESLCSISLIYAQVNILEKCTLMLDNRMGRCLYFQFEEEEEMIRMKEEIELRSFQHWQFECIKLVHYPLKCFQDVVIIDLGSCSTRAGILMEQPTLPMLFFPTICAKDKTTGKCVYGMEALESEVRKNSNLSFPVRTPEKINKHTIDIDVLGGLFEKIFLDLRIDPTKYTIQLCLPRSINTDTQNALMKLLLEDLKVEAVSLTNQALLTLYAHDVSTAVIVDVGNRMDILPVVDGFIVENGVTKLPYGGQRIIHHMKHALASKHLSLSSEIDSFMVQYIMEKAAYVAEDFENEVQLSAVNPDGIIKSINLPQFGKDSSMLEISLDDARFKIPEGLFKPELWGLDNQGIHQLVQKAIQATSVDARKRISQSIYVSGGVTMMPGFVERLSKEVSKLSKTKVMPKVFASKYRYYCTYIGACKFASMKEFPQVCINCREYSKDRVASLKKFVLCI